MVMASFSDITWMDFEVQKSSTQEKEINQLIMQNIN
jgi:hypothetical protein